LARPGGNGIGLTTISGDLVAKRLELIKEFLPTFRKIAILVRDSSPTAPQYIQQSWFAAEKLGFIRVRGPLRPAFAHDDSSNLSSWFGWSGTSTAASAVLCFPYFSHPCDAISVADKNLLKGLVDKH
jgi:hypothetical protein